jgi:hypothetical protein
MLITLKAPPLTWRARLDSLSMHYPNWDQRNFPPDFNCFPIHPGFDELKKSCCRNISHGRAFSRRCPSAGCRPKLQQPPLNLLSLFADFNYVCRLSSTQLRKKIVR